MASQTLRPHRSPSPSPAPSTPTHSTNQAKLTRQSLGPPPTAAASRGFAGLGISNAFNAQPRHASSGVTMGLSPRPSAASGLRSASGATPRPSSEFISRGDARTPEAEQIDQWFKHLASWEATLEEMAAASTDQNFTEELGAIEQWFRVLSEAERTAALYSLLQHSTPVQIRFFLSVLHHMAQSDPMTALLSPNPALSAGMQAQMEAKLAGSGLRSPSAGGGAGFPGPGSPYADDRNKLRQNRISAPGTLQPHDRWHGQLDQVVERGGSPISDRSRSPTPDIRPQSTDFTGPRMSGGIGLGLAQPEPASPMMNGSWASMTNTPLVPSFSDPSIDRVNLDDARNFRRPGARNVSGHYNDNGEFINAGQQPGRDNRSPVVDQFGFGGGDGLAGLGMNFANMNMNPMMNPAQMLALAQAQQLSTAASFAQAGYGGLRGPAKPPPGRRSPMLGKSPTPDKGGGAGSGAGVAGPDDVDMRIVEDVSQWLRVLRLHKYNSTFERTPWREMIAMSEDDLIAKGVSAQGARTKFLKVFYNVRTKFDLPHPAGSEAYAPTKE